MGEMQATNGGVTSSREANDLVTTNSNVQAYFICSLAIKQKQFDDDSYEAVLLEELSDMRERFQQQVQPHRLFASFFSINYVGMSMQVDKLTEDLKKARQECQSAIRTAEEAMAAEKAAIERRCLDLETMCAEQRLELKRLQ